MSALLSPRCRSHVPTVGPSLWTSYKQTHGQASGAFAQLVLSIWSSSSPRVASTTCARARHRHTKGGRGGVCLTHVPAQVLVSTSTGSNRFDTHCCSLAQLASSRSSSEDDRLVRLEGGAEGAELCVVVRPQREHHECYAACALMCCFTSTTTTSARTPRCRALSCPYACPSSHATTGLADGGARPADPLSVHERGHSAARRTRLERRVAHVVASIAAEAARRSAACRTQPIASRAAH
jgi:hypothetical protein